MVKRIAPVGVVSLVLLAVCGAVCQNVRTSLPDAPSARAATQELNFNGFAAEPRLPWQFGAMGGHAGVMSQGGFAASDPVGFSQKEPDIINSNIINSNIIKSNIIKSNTIKSNTILAKYLYPSLLEQQSGYRSSSSDSFTGRATYAASRMFVARNGSGKGRLNTSYLLRALTSVAAHTASRPYWRRSVGEPFSDFGSTVGNDAGVNLWREFGPGIQHLMKSHAPGFVARIEEHITHH
jgi:hypothetical protein